MHIRVSGLLIVWAEPAIRKHFVLQTLQVQMVNCPQIMASAKPGADRYEREHKMKFYSQEG